MATVVTDVIYDNDANTLVDYTRSSISRDDLHGLYIPLEAKSFTTVRLPSGSTTRSTDYSCSYGLAVVNVEQSSDHPIKKKHKRRYGLEYPVPKTKEYRTQIPKAVQQRGISQGEINCYRRHKSSSNTDTIEIEDEIRRRTARAARHQEFGLHRADAIDVPVKSSCVRRHYSSSASNTDTSELSDRLKTRLLIKRELKKKVPSLEDLDPPVISARLHQLHMKAERVLLSEEDAWYEKGLVAQIKYAVIAIFETCSGGFPKYPEHDIADEIFDSEFIGGMHFGAKHQIVRI